MAGAQALQVRSKQAVTQALSQKGNVEKPEQNLSSRLTLHVG